MVLLVSRRSRPDLLLPSNRLSLLHLVLVNLREIEFLYHLRIFYAVMLRIDCVLVDLLSLELFVCFNYSVDGPVVGTRAGVEGLNKLAYRIRILPLPHLLE